MDVTILLLTLVLRIASLLGMFIYFDCRFRCTLTDRIVMCLVVMLWSMCGTVQTGIILIP